MRRRMFILFNFYIFEQTKIHCTVQNVDKEKFRAIFGANFRLKYSCHLNF